MTGLMNTVKFVVMPEVVMSVFILKIMTVMTEYCG